MSGGGSVVVATLPGALRPLIANASLARALQGDARPGITR